MTKKRLKAPSTCFHIFNRRIEGNDIFLDDDDRWKFHYIINDLISEKELKFVTHAYTLMTNHFHLLIETFDEDISKILYFLGFKYAKYFNRKYQRKGYLFQDRFGSRIIFDKHHFKIVQAYVHNNLFEIKKDSLTFNKLHCSYSCFLDGQSIFKHFNSTSINLYQEGLVEFKKFTKEQLSTNPYNTNYEFSDQLFLINRISKSIHQSQRWLVTSFLLKTYTQASFKQIATILNIENSDSLKSKYHRFIKIFPEETKEQIKAHYEEYLKNCYIPTPG